MNLEKIFKIYRIALIFLIPILMVSMPIKLVYINGLRSIVELYLIDYPLNLAVPAFIGVVILSFCFLIKNKYVPVVVPVGINIILDLLYYQPLSGITPISGYYPEFSHLDDFRLTIVTGKGYLYIKLLLIVFLVLLYVFTKRKIFLLETGYIVLTIAYYAIIGLLFIPVIFVYLLREEETVEVVAIYRIKSK